MPQGTTMARSKPTNKETGLVCSECGAPLRVSNYDKYLCNECRATPPEITYPAFLAPGNCVWYVDRVIRDQKKEYYTIYMRPMSSNIDLDQGSFCQRSQKDKSKEAQIERLKHLAYKFNWKPITENCLARLNEMLNRGERVG